MKCLCYPSLLFERILCDEPGQKKHTNKISIKRGVTHEHLFYENMVGYNICYFHK